LREQKSEELVTNFEQKVQNKEGHTDHPLLLMMTKEREVSAQ